MKKNANGLESKSKYISGDIKRSQYMKLHYSGKISELRIKINNVSEMPAYTMDIDNIKLNVKVPLMFSWTRVIILAILLMLLYMIRPGSALYKIKTDLHRPKQLVAAVLLLAVQSASVGYMTTWSMNRIDKQKDQYYNLVDAFKDGRLDIRDPGPSEELKNMKDPYDAGERERLNVKYREEYAYYNGKYYIYPGVVPVLTMYLPYNLVTGKNLPNHAAALIACILMLTGAMLLLWEIIKKWFKNTPFVLYLLLCTIFPAGAGVSYLIVNPSLYVISISQGAAFGMIGIALWLSSKTEIIYKNETGTEDKIITWRIALGSLCIALIAGCRPQLVVVIAFGVMLFWNDIFKKRKLFSKTSIPQTLALCAPFIAVAAGIMWYNYARFDSPFNFGYNYILETNDAVQRKFISNNIGLGYFSYLFQPTQITGTFPFLTVFEEEFTYLWYENYEYMIGGVLFLYPILSFGIYGMFKKKLFNDKQAYRMIYFSIISALIIIFADTYKAGTLARCILDFSWLIMLAASITVMICYDRLDGNIRCRGKFMYVALAASCLTLAVSFLSIFAYGEIYLTLSNPALYYKVRQLIAFWN